MPVAFDDAGLHFRDWRADDAATMVRLFDTEQMNRWTPLPSPFTCDVAVEYVARAHRLRDEDGTLQLAVSLAADTDVVGELILFPAALPDTVELAYAVGADHQGAGVATRAVIAGVDLAQRAGLGRAVLTIARGNDASAAVARKAGFLLEDGPAAERRRKGFVLQMQTWTRALSGLPRPPAAEVPDR